MQRSLAAKEAAFLDLILRAYRAEKVEQFECFHGKRAGRLVAVGPVNLPVTRLFVEVRALLTGTSKAVRCEGIGGHRASVVGVAADPLALVACASGGGRVAQAVGG